MEQPTHCPAGHLLEPPNVTVGWPGSDCTRHTEHHRVWRCKPCGDKVVWCDVDDEAAPSPKAEGR